MSDLNVVNVYQPIFSLSESKIISYEVLCRCKTKHGELGARDTLLLYNERFDFPILLKIIKNLIDDRCCFKVDDKFNLNVSIKDISDRNTVLSFVDICFVNGFSLSNIVFEITEHDDYGIDDEVIFCIEYLIKEGVTISIDDFGCGFNSFDKLILLPVNQVKISGDIINKLYLYGCRSLELRELISLLNKSGLSVVAEGIESEEQLIFARELGFDCVQGFIISKPKLSEDILISDDIFNFVICD